MTFKELEAELLAKPGAKLDYPFGKDVAVYKVADKLFGLMPHDKQPATISLKCDPNLAELLREKYDEVMPGYHLNKKHWNTIVITGQLSEQELKDLISHSYQLVVESLPAEQRAALIG